MRPSHFEGVLIKKLYLATATATFGIATVAALGFAGPASAAPTGGRDAADAVSDLRDQGYAVQVEVQAGPRDVPLSECTVNDVNGLRGDNPSGQPLKPAQLGTVYVVVECPSNGSN